MIDGTVCITILTLFLHHLQVNPKAAESLSDPEEYPNLFEDWQLALTLESQAAETRGVYRPAAEYLQHADRSHMTHVEAFRNMPVEEDPMHASLLIFRQHINLETALT
ncbi:hypothetical protein V6N13_130240 [Hibiscus sabdariffa]